MVKLTFQQKEFSKEANGALDESLKQQINSALFQNSSRVALSLYELLYGSVMPLLARSNVSLKKALEYMLSDTEFLERVERDLIDVSMKAGVQDGIKLKNEVFYSPDQIDVLRQDYADEFFSQLNGLELRDSKVTVADTEKDEGIVPHGPLYTLYRDQTGAALFDFAISGDYFRSVAFGPQAYKIVVSKVKQELERGLVDAYRAYLDNHLSFRAEYFSKRLEGIFHVESGSGEISFVQPCLSSQARFQKLIDEVEMMHYSFGDFWNMVLRPYIARFDMALSYKVVSSDFRQKMDSALEGSLAVGKNPVKKNPNSPKIKSGKSANELRQEAYSHFAHQIRTEFFRT